MRLLCVLSARAWLGGGAREARRGEVAERSGAGVRAVRGREGGAWLAVGRQDGGRARWPARRGEARRGRSSEERPWVYALAGGLERGGTERAGVKSGYGAERTSGGEAGSRVGRGRGELEGGGGEGVSPRLGSCFSARDREGEVSRASFMRRGARGGKGRRGIAPVVDDELVARLEALRAGGDGGGKLDAAVSRAVLCGRIGTGATGTAYLEQVDDRVVRRGRERVVDVEELARAAAARGAFVPCQPLEAHEDEGRGQRGTDERLGRLRPERLAQVVDDELRRCARKRYDGRATVSLVASRRLTKGRERSAGDAPGTGKGPSL